jgi:hypothetical protein
MLSQSKKGKASRDYSGNYARALGHEKKQAYAEKPDANHCGQSSRNRAFAEEPMRAPGEQIEHRRVEICAVDDRRPCTLESGQTTKVGGKEFVEPKTFPAGSKKSICEVNGRNQKDAEDGNPG